MLKTRVITALILTTILGAALFYLPLAAWSLLMVGIVSVSFWEWAKLSKFNRSLQIVYVSLILVLGLALVLAGPAFINIAVFWGALVAAFFWLLLAPVLLYTQKQIKNKFLLSVLGAVIIVPFGLAMIALREINPFVLLVFILAVSIADSAAYFAGKTFGQHKLAPSISPGKTWEGVIGAFVGVSIYGLFLCQVTHQSLMFVPFLWFVTVLSIMGDLIESLFKRQADVKDSGNLLPGHGGVLDRIDGLTASLPLVTFVIALPMYLGVFFHG